MNVRKGVSPLIAVVLLIVFTVAVSTMIMSWMNTYTKTTTTSASANTDTVIQCSQQTVSIPTTSGVIYNTTTGLVTVNIENNGQATTNIKKVIAYDVDGDTCILTPDTTELEVGDIVTNQTNCYTADSSWSNCTETVRVTTECGGIYDEWSNSVAC